MGEGYIFSNDIYDTMLEQWEMWFVYKPYCTEPIYDASLMEC